MKEFVEKLIERLEENTIYDKQAISFMNKYGRNIGFISKGKAIKIVKDFASEHNNGWISVEDEFPEILGNTSDTVLVCCSNGFQYMAFWCDDLQWRFCECGTAKEPVVWTEIIAWQPLPAPYKKGE